jgi:hypothetical protein
MEVKQDTGNLKPAKPDRRKSGKRIDGMVAMIMAVDQLIRNQNKTSVYEFRGLLSF